MLSSELKELKNSITSINRNEVNNLDKDNIEIKTNQGDIIKLVFNNRSYKQHEIMLVGIMAWKNKITEYTLLPEGYVYLKPKIFWDIYKKVSYGKEFLCGTGYKMYVNDELYTFPDTKFYFSNQTPSQKGVYGIYYHDELLFIGSSSDILETWIAHDKSIRINFLSYGIQNPDEVEYRILENSYSIGKIINCEDCSAWIFELIAYSYIRALNPKWNKKDTSTNIFYAKKGDLPIDYWEIVKSWLQEDNHNKIVPAAVIDEDTIEFQKIT